MRSVETTIGLEVPAPDLGGAALFLDLDGTLAPIADHPDQVGPDPRRNHLLDRLADRLDGRVAVISGRALPDLDRILERRPTAVGAVHGLVRRDAFGRVHEPRPHAEIGAARRALENFVQDRPGLLVEDKGLSLALHYRQAPDRAAEAVAEASSLAAETGLDLQHGRCVVELRSPGPRKGDALRAFMAEAPFKGARPVFLGDDLTDEDAFLAAADLGGYGVLVGPPRRTAARYGLPDVDAVLTWLELVR